jgi:hypothetical protein
MAGEAGKQEFIISRRTDMRRYQPAFIRICASVFLIASAFSPRAHATVIFSNFGPGLSYDTSGGNPIGNLSDGNTYGEAGVFTTGSAADALDSIQIALSCAFSCLDPVVVTLSSDNSGQPGAILESFQLAAVMLGTLGDNNPPLLLTSALEPVLAANTQYWVTVSSDLNDSIAWNWNLAGDTSPEALSVDGGVSWFAPSGLTPGAFEVNTVSIASPEPSSLGLMLGAGLLLACLWRSRVRGPGADEGVRPTV